MKRTGALLLALGLPWFAGSAETLLLATGGFRPIAYEEDGHPSGALCDVLSEAARRAGITVEFRFLPWARAMTETEAGRIDAIFPSFKTPEREAKFIFPSEVLLTETMSWFVRADSPLNANPNLAIPVTWRIGLVNHTTSGDKIDQARAKGLLLNIEIMPNLPDAVKILAAGRVDLVPGFNQGFRVEAQHLGFGTQIRELTPSFDSLPAYLAFSRVGDHMAEIRALDMALKTMKEDGSYQSILDRYFVTKPQ